MESLGEQLRHQAHFALGYQGVMLSGMRAALHRGSGDAVDKGTADLRACASADAAHGLLEGRRRDLARVRLYARELRRVVEALDPHSDVPSATLD